MTADHPQTLATAQRSGQPAAFHIERRPGEAVLLAPEQRRPMPPGGISVLLLGPSIQSLMIHGLLFGDLPAVSRLDPVADPGEALASLARRPGRYDLVLVVERSRGSDAIDFAEALCARSGDDDPEVPFVVGLADALTPEAEDRFRRSGACAAALMLPLSHARFRALLEALFNDRPAPPGA